jgi:DNA polymerase III delta prime subunit
MMEAISPETGHRLNGASNADRNYILERLTDYASSRGLFYDGKLTVIDQADLLPKQAQNEVLWVLERPRRLARLILVVNDEKKIIPAIRSRLLPICFDVAAEKRDDAQERLGERYCSILSKVGITCPRSRIDEIVNTHFPDMWKIESALEWEFPVSGSNYNKKAVELRGNEQKEHQPV